MYGKKNQYRGCPNEFLSRFQNSVRLTSNLKKIPEDYKTNLTKI